MRCAVYKCKQSNSNTKKSTSGKPVHFYTFPKNAAQRKLWVEFCNRGRPTNTQTERICSLHFKQEDFERNLRFEMGFSNRCAPKLKSGVVPTIKTPVIAYEGQSNHCDEKNTSTVTDPIKNEIEPPTCDEENTTMTTDINEDSLQLYIKTLKTEMDALRQENDMLKMAQSQSAITIKKLYSQVQSLSFAYGNLEKALGRIFTEGQIRKLKNGDKRQIFTEADIAQSITLYSTSPKAYMLLKNKKFPLPSVRTLQRWSQKLNVSTGILEPDVKILSAANQTSETPRLRVLSFDELKAKKSTDTTSQRTLC